MVIHFYNLITLIISTSGTSLDSTVTNEGVHLHKIDFVVFMAVCKADSAKTMILIWEAGHTGVHLLLNCLLKS
jgi:hypothetical protein